MPRYRNHVFGWSIAVLLVAGPYAYWSWERKYIRNFHVVRDRVLYRGGQMSVAGLKRLVHDYGIKTVVTLRDKYQPADLAEEDYCRERDIAYVRIPPRRWWAAVGEPPADQGVREFLRVMDHPDNFPVLLHCFAGIHRTGAYCAIFRMEYERWSNDKAASELRAQGYTNLDDELDVLGYLEHYRPRWQTRTASLSPRSPITPRTHPTTRAGGRRP